MPETQTDSDIVFFATKFIEEHCIEEETVRLNIQLPPDLVALLDAIVEKSGRSRSLVIEQMLFLGLNNVTP